MGTSIAVAGKGGTGKTTLAALVVLELTRRGLGPVLVIDADPDANLGTILGLEVEKTIGDLREEVLEEIKNFPPGMSKADYVEAGLHQIIEETPKFDLITMGRGEGSGCYCYLNTLVRKFSEELFPSYKWIVMDNEAGLEHISRRTTSNINNLLIVVNDNPISLNTAKSILELSTKLKNSIDNLYIITNMVKDERKAELMNRIKDLDVEYLGDIPYDNLLGDAIFNNNPLADLKGSIAVERISKILDKIGG
ncbi:MAG: AAA family ATPase [Spirochaetota bacterium]|nr:MAG: AAA family ATPase [Spirochaetota bacterium]